MVVTGSNTKKDKIYDVTYFQNDRKGVSFETNELKNVENRIWMFVIKSNRTTINRYCDL